jgi:NitT/TauT family transport system ATP-binding protein
MDIISVDDVKYSINDSSIISSISFVARKEKFVSLIGPSGCGKSTLLRIIAGLIPATEGRVLFKGSKIVTPIKEISFVFQDFGLLPWLSNVENVKLGLSMLKMNDEEKTQRAMSILKNFGLEGFENSYPNVLSGGMKQRVGLARAMVSEPVALLMDEPFSALDELTATALRTEVVRMLLDKKIAVISVIMVTHNIEEAVELSDDIVVLSNKPTKVKKIVHIDLDRPRDKRSKQFLDAVDSVSRILKG